MPTFYQYLAFILPFAYTLINGYFLSVEFSLYPYFISVGLLPYKNIVDQHFPSHFFGFFSFPFILVNDPKKLLIMLVSLNLLTIYLLLVTLKNLKVIRYQAWTLIFSLLLVFFSVNTLWIETFICFYLTLVFFLSTKKEPYYHFVSGIIISQAILLRPTIAFFLFGYFLYLAKNKAHVFFGSLFGFILSFWYLVEKNILLDFYQVVIAFNRDVYAFVQSQAPTFRQIFTIGLLILIFTGLNLWKKKYLYAILGLSTTILAWPRFGLEHLQVFILTFVYFLSQLNLDKKVINFLLAISILVSVQSWLSILKGVYGNYFYTPTVLEISKQIKQLPDKNIYLYGASDLIYQLAEKLPPNNYYLPSLPWYINHMPFQKKLKQSLLLTKTVIIDPDFTVDGQKLIDTTPELLSYIKMNYYKDGNIKHLEIYKLKQ